MGLLGMTVAESLGGSGLNSLDLVIVVEEIARACPSVAVSLSVSNSVCCWPINRFGSEELKRRVLPALAAGKTLGAFALTAALIPVVLLLAAQFAFLAWLPILLDMPVLWLGSLPMALGGSAAIYAMLAAGAARLLAGREPELLERVLGES